MVLLRNPSPGDVEQGVLHDGFGGDPGPVERSDGKQPVLFFFLRRRLSCGTGLLERCTKVHREAKRNGGGGEKYRLPTEAEWEYAARAGSQTAFANGGMAEAGVFDSNLDAMGWFKGNSLEKTHPVEEKMANDWGLYDMHGNVWEWCQDWYDRDWYDRYPSGAVIDPSGPSSGSVRVSRGGGYGNDQSDCRSAKRHYVDPGKRSSGIGFRLARDLDRWHISASATSKREKTPAAVLPQDHASVDPRLNRPDIAARQDRWVQYTSGVVYDPKTGLEWYAFPYGVNGFDWHKAEKAVANLSIDGGRWRMPTVEELKSLYFRYPARRYITRLLPAGADNIWSGDALPDRDWNKYYFDFQSGATKSISSYTMHFGCIAVRPAK